MQFVIAKNARRYLKRAAGKWKVFVRVKNAVFLQIYRWQFLRFTRASLLEFIKFAWSSTRFDVRIDTQNKSSKPRSTQQAKPVIPPKLPEAEILTLQLQYLLERFVLRFYNLKIASSFSVFQLQTR